MIQNLLNLRPANMDELKLIVFSNPYDLRHDLHAFIEYVWNRDVKRSHRSNALPRPDSKRLAKLISGDTSSTVKEVESWVYSNLISKDMKDYCLR